MGMTPLCFCIRQPLKGNGQTIVDSQQGTVDMLHTTSIGACCYYTCV